MDALIKYGGLQKNPLYSCQENHPIGERREIIGVASILMGIVASFFFIYCLKIMLNPDLFKLSCYKIMFFVGVVDVLAIFISAILTGVLGYIGATFCDYPFLIYISGALGLSFWCCSCLANIVLLINRILCFKSIKYYEMFFDGFRTYVALILPIIYGLYFLIFTKPVIFSPTIFAWIFDPQIYSNRSSEYRNIYHTMNNFVMVVITSVLYIWILVIVLQNWIQRKKSADDNHSRLTSKTKNTILKQAVAICAIDQIGSIAYVAMNFIIFPAWSGVFAQLLWFCAHSFPIVIYLTMNRTMMSRFSKIFCKSKLNNAQINPSSAVVTK